MTNDTTNNTLQSSSATTQLLAQFDEFFSIACQFNVNISLLSNDNNAIDDINSESISYAEFLERMPLPFKMASEINTIDQAALKPLQNVGGVAEQLMKYLEHQNQKIDLLVSYIVHQQDDAKSRFEGMQLGGGGIVFYADTPFKDASKIEAKIFLTHENAAIYCYGIIAETTPYEQGYLHKVVFEHIRDEDRESLVRASLHLQSKQLKELSAKRNQLK